MQTSFLFTTLAYLAGQGLAEFWIGGYSGLMEDGGIANPGLSQMGGIWVGDALSCDNVGIGSGFSQDTNDIGESLYNWCDQDFAVTGNNDDKPMYMGSSGSRCGQPCDTDDACQQDATFADLFDSETDAQIGTCVWDFSWDEDCVSFGSLMYSSRVHCIPGQCKTETQTILCDTMCDMNPWEDDVDKCHDDCHPECGV